MDINRAFISKVLREEVNLMDSAMQRAIRKRRLYKYGRSGRLLNERTVTVAGNKATLTHPIHQRFLDMRSRLRDGTKRKKAHKIHNSIIMGHYNEIAYKLRWGLTQDVIRDFKKAAKE